MERVFYGLVFRKINKEKNQNRVYVLLWQENLFGEWELVRIWGRAGTDARRMKATPYPSLEAAWPEIRRIVRKRIRHGYRAFALRHTLSLDRETWPLNGAGAFRRIGRI